MKKCILIIALSLISFSLYAANREMVLTSSDLTFRVQQGKVDPAFESINFVRTAQSSDKVRLFVQFSKKVPVCVRYEYREVWVPGSYETICRTDHLGNTRCQQVWHSGYYRREAYCVEYDSVDEVETNKYFLDFTDAANLSGNEQEVFEVTFSQKDNYSAVVHLSAKVVKAERNYEIKSRGALKWKGLDFIAK